MKIRIWRPRLLAVVVVCLAVGGGTAAAVAWPGGEESGPELAVPRNQSEEPRPVTDEELARALEIIEKDGQVYEVNGGQPFTVRPRVTEERADGRTMVALDLVWEKPVESVGPWTVELCRGLVRVRGTARWKNLRSVSAYVDLTEGTVRVFAPPGAAVSAPDAPPDEEQLAELDPTYEAEGEIIEQPEGWSLTIEPNKPFRCPEGYEDDYD